MKTRPYLLLILFISFTQLTSIAQSTIPPLAGWKMEEKDGAYVFKPEKGSDAKEFVYEVMPSSKNEGLNPEAWFNNAIDRDLQESGFALMEPGRKNITSNQTISSFSSEVTDKKGNHWYVTYISYQPDRNEYRLGRIVSSPDVKYYATWMRPAASHFNSLAEEERAHGTLAVKTTSSAAQEKSENNLFALTDEAAAEKGLKSPDINGVLIHLEYNAAPDGKMVRVYTPYLVLNDGSIYSDPVLSPYNFNVGMSKVKEPEKWGLWKMKGEAMLINWTGRNTTEKWVKNWFWATPATNNELIEGTFMTAAGKINVNVKNDESNSSKYISFNNKGQFTIAGTETNGNVTVSPSDFSNRNEAGTYILNDFSVELHFNNGTVIRRSFYYYLQGKTHFGIANQVYVPKRFN